MAKKMAGAEHDAEALEAICKAYIEGEVTATPAWLVETVADYLSGLDADERAKFGAAVNARVTPSRRHGPAKGLFIGAEVVQPAGFGARSSSRPDAGSRGHQDRRDLPGLAHGGPPSPLWTISPR